jgi:hypothetical protein
MSNPANIYIFVDNNFEIQENNFIDSVTSRNYLIFHPSYELC